MSFREKHLWISIVSTVLVWGFYYLRLYQAIAAGGLEAGDFPQLMGGLFIGCLVVTVVIEIVLTIIATVTTSKAEREARDERETLAALKASHVSLMLLITLVASLSFMAYFAGLLDPGMNQRPGIPATSANALVLIANLLMGSVIVSELVRHGFTLGLLKRGR